MTSVCLKARSSFWAILKHAFIVPSYDNNPRNSNKFLGFKEISLGQK
jgi:hypothetical protein